MIRRFLAVLHARNMEFLRDRSSWGWSVAMPVMLVLAMAWIFWEDDQTLFKVAVFDSADAVDPSAHPFFATRHVDFFTTQNLDDAVHKVARHQIDMLIRLGDLAAYWVNEDSPRGYILERMLFGSRGASMSKQVVSGEPVRYIDWLLPGILGMNMMFSCLFGVGFIVVHYRKTGFLKRLNATPLRAVEFITAQIVSRLLITLLTTTLLFWGTSVFLNIRMEGSYLQLLVVAVLGAFALIALALVVASRVSSEELANGLLNLLVWPMMIMSGVWFSLEGASEFLQAAARLLPLTHILEAARAVMIDGSGWSEITANLVALAVMGFVLLALGARLFKWRSD